MSSLPSNSRRSHILIRIGKFFVIGTLLIFVLIALLLLGISLKGRYDLAETKAELLAKGEKLTLAELAPPPIPDGQNFFADPMWMELADLVESEENSATRTPRIPKGERQLDGLTRTLTDEELAKLELEFPEFADLLAESPSIGAARKAWKAAEEEPESERKRAAEFVLAVQVMAEPLFSRIISLTEREGGSFPLRFEDSAWTESGYLSSLLTVGQFLRLHALANVELGHRDVAQRDVLSIFKLADTFAAEPLLILLLVRTGLEAAALSPINIGIAQHTWHDNNLMQFESHLTGRDPRPRLVSTFRGERGWFNQMMNPPDKAFPKIPLLGILPQSAGMFLKLAINGYIRIFGAGDQATYNRVLQEAIDEISEEATFRPKDFSTFNNFSESNGGIQRFTRTFSTLSLPALNHSVERIANIQTQINQTRIACALERYRIAEGEYPENLTALVPQFLNEIPPDVITLQSPHYCKLPDGKFLLWSVGWNETDEGGQPGLKRGGGDWVWGERLR